LESISTQFIILRKTKYGESSLIISTLSLEYGKLDFIVQGAKKLGSKSFPVIDLFREVKGECRLKENGLNKLRSYELVENYDGVVVIPENYIAACSIAKFITANTHPLVAMPILYRASKNALSKLSAGSSGIPWGTLIKLVFLYEQGLLPDVLSGKDNKESEDDKQKLLRDLLELACGDDSINVDCSYWPLFTPWINSLCDFQNIKY